MAGAAQSIADRTYPLFVSAEACRQVLVFADVINALRAAYSVPHGPLVSPPRVVTRGQGNWLRALAASPPGLRYMGAKIFGFGRAKSVSYLIALFEQETGALAALVDANLVTAYRTAATPRPIIERLNEALRRALADPQVVKAYKDSGTEAFPPDQWSIEAATAFVQRELDRWAKDVRENNIRVEQ